MYSKLAMIACCPAAVYREAMPVDVAALRGGEKERGVRDFRRRAGTPQWDMGQHLRDGTAKLAVFAVEEFLRPLRQLCLSTAIGFILDALHAGIAAAVVTTARTIAEATRSDFGSVDDTP